MTTPNPRGAAAFRRAAAFYAHHSRGDVEGMNAVLVEVLATGDARAVGELAVSLCTLFDMVIPQLLTPVAVQFVQRAVLLCAGIEDGPG